MSKSHLVQQQPLLRGILKKPIIPYRKRSSLRRVRERKIMARARKLGVLRNHLGRSTPIYTGALIKPVSETKKYFLGAHLYPSQPLSRLRIGDCLGLALLSSSRISPLNNLLSHIPPRFQASSCILPNLSWTLSTASFTIRDLLLDLVH